MLGVADQASCFTPINFDLGPIETRGERLGGSIWALLATAGAFSHSLASLPVKNLCS